MSLIGKDVGPVKLFLVQVNRLLCHVKRLVSGQPDCQVTCLSSCSQELWICMRTAQEKVCFYTPSKLAWKVSH
jgi:hypothetical protein